MKNVIIIISIVFAVLACLSFTVKSYHNPETVILGNWKEIHWEYERVYYSAHVGKASSSTPKKIKKMSTADMGIVGAENWIFSPDGTLVLSNKNEKKLARWKIKGRGNILMVTYTNNEIEQYNISKLTDDSLELNFVTATGIRGIAKVSCVKI